MLFRIFFFKSSLLKSTLNGVKFFNCELIIDSSDKSNRECWTDTKLPYETVQLSGKTSLSSASKSDLLRAYKQSSTIITKNEKHQRPFIIPNITTVAVGDQVTLAILPLLWFDNSFRVKRFHSACFLFFFLLFQYPLYLFVVLLLNWACLLQSVNLCFELYACYLNQTANSCQHEKKCVNARFRTLTTTCRKV